LVCQGRVVVVIVVVVAVVVVVVVVVLFVFVLENRLETQKRTSTAEARGQFGNPEQVESPLFEAVGRRLGKTQQAEKTLVWYMAICKDEGRVLTCSYGL
jgi:flagellar basal body-associated protein FliL